MHLCNAGFAAKYIQIERKTLICAVQHHQNPPTSPFFQCDWKAKGEGTKSSHQSCSKKHFLVVLLWPFIVPHSDWHCFWELCRAARGTFLVLRHLSVSALLMRFPFQVTIKQRVQSTWTDFPSQITGSKRKPILLHFMHAENKRKISAVRRRVSTERDSGVKGLSVPPYTYSAPISKYMFCMWEKNRILFCDMDKISQIRTFFWQSTER